MTITAKTVRYIKLGKGGRWEKVSLERGELHFGHRNVPHELALTGDRDQRRGWVSKDGTTPIYPTQ